MPDLLSDLVSDESTILPECIINIKVRCSEVLQRVLTRCAEVSTRISNWCQEKFSKYERECIIIVKSIGIIMYVLDLGTDTFVGIKYFSTGKFVAGSVTFIFATLPMLILGYKLIIHTSLDGQNSMNIKILPSLSAVICSPILPLGWLVLELVASIGVDDSNSNNDKTLTITESLKITAAKAARIVKLFVAVVESFPQATIQLFIAFGSLAAGEIVEIWQWGSIAVSLTSLSLSVSTGHLNANAAGSSKAIYFIFGLLAVTSRQIVCCVYSIHYPIFWLIPFCTQLTISIISWVLSSKCQGQCASLLIFVLTEAYNSFTLSGLLTSSIYLIFAIGGLFILEQKPEVQPVINKIQLVTVILSSVSWAFNFLFTFIPLFKGIRIDWMMKNEEETTEHNANSISNTDTKLDVQSALPFDAEVQVHADEAPTDEAETQSDVEFTLAYVNEIQPEAMDTPTVANQYQPEADVILAYSNEKQSEFRKTRPNVQTTFHDAQDSLTDAKVFQTYGYEESSNVEKILCHVNEAKGDSDESSSDIEETHF